MAPDTAQRNARTRSVKPLHERCEFMREYPVTSESRINLNVNGERACASEVGIQDLCDDGG